MANPVDTQRTAAADPRSVPQLLGELARDLTTLFRKEGQLVRAELADKIAQLEIGAGSLAAGAVCLLAALLVLLQALVIALSNVMPPGWASLVVGVVVAIVGVVLLKVGANQMKAANLAPERTTHQLNKDAELVREQVR
ncbi:phage holin family protein [Propylenella binzhouense]|uniref:Phage holin family protein n=1 Tax=Propylenella binzhouense TaxID=2555902 RepID=A0A964T3Z0_9HYPH|nr:phage holin family protein [Propylenella binzhouense]MYZ47955.1 phage holin family protein [Propylenella binzhouense]